MKRWLVVLVLGCGRVGFEPLAGDAVVAEEELVVSCERDVDCHVVCTNATSCDVECTGSASCTVLCPEDGCRVTGCEGDACTVTCGFTGLASRAGTTATCP